MPKSDKAMWDVNSNHEERAPYSRNKGSYTGDKFCERSEQNLLRQGSDDGDKPIMDISGNYDICIGEYAGYRGKEWKPGPLPRVGKSSAPEHRTSDTKQVSAASPTGRYGKKGGTGQRSGA